MNEQTLFIIEEPYVSELLLTTLEKNSIPVLKNKTALDYKKYNLNFVNTEPLKDTVQKIYSNSENSINWVLNTFPNSNTSEFIKICKDKYVFRKNLKILYPNFYFQKISVDDFDKIKNIPDKFIIKPSVGFLSMGVHKVNNKNEWENVKYSIKHEILNFEKNFPSSVLNSTEFILEEIIEGDEYAVDAYFNEEGEPVILNIFKHPFVSENDVSDRAYISSKEIIEKNIENFTTVLSKIGNTLNIKDFPIHIELIKKTSGETIPVEINPMRFAGWCTTDLAYFAYGINIYEYFYYNKKPDWENLLKNKENEIYYFAMAETPTDIDKNKINFNYEKLKTCFSSIFDFRKTDYKTKPVFAIIFGKTNNYEEIAEILKLDMHDFIKSL